MSERGTRSTDREMSEAMWELFKGVLADSVGLNAYAPCSEDSSRMMRLRILLCGFSVVILI
jgi:hypothetical protein